MVIFHSYVNLPEGRRNVRPHQVVIDLIDEVVMIFLYLFPGLRFFGASKDQGIHVFRYRNGLPLSRSSLFADLQFLFADLRSGFSCQ